MLDDIFPGLESLPVKPSNVKHIEPSPTAELPNDILPGIENSFELSPSFTVATLMNSSLFSNQSMQVQHPDQAKAPNIFSPLPHEMSRIDKVPQEHMNSSLSLAHSSADEVISTVSTPPLPTVQIPSQILSETQAFLAKIQEILSAIPVDLPGYDRQPVGVVPYSQPTHPPFIPVEPRTIPKFQSFQRIREHQSTQSNPSNESSPMRPVIDEISTNTDNSRTEDIPSGLLYGGVRKAQHRLVISEEERDQLLQEGHKPPQYSASVQKQNKMTSDIYDSFISQMKTLVDYPVSALAAVAFLTWLERSDRLCARTIDQVIWASLCRLNILRVHAHIDPYTKSCARAKIAQIYRNKKCKPSGMGMHPLIPDDLSRIIIAFPKQSSRAALLASLFLFALSTGARGDSCSHVRLGDFLNLTRNCKGDCLIGVRLTKLKSRPGQYLDLTLAGRVDVESSIDVVYWLNKYLIQRFNSSLEEVCSPEKTRPTAFYTQKLWPYSTDSMSQALKSSMRAAGFNPAGFGFHSFRSGFLASVLSVATAKGGSFHDTMTMAALITGWNPLSAIQLNYIKQTTRRNLVTTNLIGVTDTPSHFRPPTFKVPEALESPTGAGNYVLQSSLDFHHLDKLEPVEQHRSFAFEVKRLLGEKIRIPSASPLSNYNYLTTSYHWCLTQFARTELGSDLSGLETYNSLRMKGMGIVDRRLKSNPNSGPAIADEMYSMLKAKDKLKTTLPTDYYRTDYICKGPTRQSITTALNKKRRARIEWSKEEEAIFEAGLIQKKTAREIADDLFIRTPEDVRYHLRALNKKRAQEIPPQPPLLLGKAVRTGPRHPPASARRTDSDIVSSESDSDSDTSSEAIDQSSSTLDEEESSSEESET